MSARILRQLIAAVLVMVGIGAASSALPAQAAPAASNQSVQHTTVSPNDWQW